VQGPPVNAVSSEGQHRGCGGAGTHWAQGFPALSLTSESPVMDRCHPPGWPALTGVQPPSPGTPSSDAVDQVVNSGAVLPVARV
jgi:hypothetical protein